MKTDTDWIANISSGRLGITSRPRGGDWLEDEVRGWRASGVDTVVSLLTREEVAELNLENEESFCREQGIAFRSLPIPDRGVPLSRASMQELVTALKHDLDSGRAVAVHCRQGIGRSALVVASVMICSGEDPDRAFQAIESARGCPVPDTIEQRNWVKQFAMEETQAPRQAAAADG